MKSLNRQLDTQDWKPGEQFKKQTFKSGGYGVDQDRALD